MANKEVDGLIGAARAQGFTATRTSKSHWVVRDPEGNFVTTVAGTPSDRRSLANAIA